MSMSTQSRGPLAAERNNGCSLDGFTLIELLVVIPIDAYWLQDHSTRVY
jgi:type II secretory pathway pseudopilin PulG